MAQLIIKDIPDVLRNDFKAICAKKGTTMKAEIIKFIRKEVEKAAQKD